MANVNAATLRAARQRRLAAVEGNQQSYSTPSANPKAKPATVAATQEPTTVENLTVAVLNPSEISKSASLDMVLYNEGTNDPHWMITAGGRPLAEVRLSDQDNPAQNAAMFVSASYAQHLIEAAKQVDIQELLTSIKARPYIASVTGSDAFKALEDRADSIAKTAYAKKSADLRSNMLNVLSFVVEAQTKNFLTENALKDGLYEKMAEIGIEKDRIVSIVEAAWQENAGQYFEATFDQARKWMDLSPEVYAELRENISGRGHSMPVTASVHDDRIPTAAKNVPFLTYTASAQPEEAPADPKAALRDKLSFNSRRRNHTMSSK